MTVDATANSVIVAPTGLEPKITDTKLYVPVVTLSRENNIKLLEQLKSEFKRTMKWNKCRSQMTVQPQNNNWIFLIDPTFRNVNRLFVLSFSRNNAGHSRDSFSHYYVPSIKIKDFNDLIDGKINWFASKKWRRSLWKPAIITTIQLVINFNFTSDWNN